METWKFLLWILVPAVLLGLPVLWMVRASKTGPGTTSPSSPSDGAGDYASRWHWDDSAAKDWFFLGWLVGTHLIALPALSHPTRILGGMEALFFGPVQFISFLPQAEWYWRGACTLGWIDLAWVGAILYHVVPRKWKEIPIALALGSTGWGLYKFLEAAGAFK